MEGNHNSTTVERKSELELVVTRTIDAPARLVFEAWTNPDLFRRWWVPKSYGLNLVGCDMDIRAGGKMYEEFVLENHQVLLDNGLLKIEKSAEELAKEEEERLAAENNHGYGFPGGYRRKQYPPNNR